MIGHTVIAPAGSLHNPFLTERFEPGAVPFIGRGESSLDAIVTRLISLGRRGQIIGPHGSGKTTLLVHLAARARDLGWRVRIARARDAAAHEWLRRSVDRAASCDPAASRRLDAVPRVLFLDSAEMLSPWRWRILSSWSALRGVGLVVTTHRDLGLPVLHERRVDAHLARAVVASIVQGSGSGPESQDELPGQTALDAMLAARQGNVRDVLFDLYDEHERRARAGAGEKTSVVVRQTGSAAGRDRYHEAR